MIQPVNQHRRSLERESDRFGRTRTTESRLLQVSRILILIELLAPLRYGATITDLLRDISDTMGQAFCERTIRRDLHVSWHPNSTTHWRLKQYQLVPTIEFLTNWGFSTPTLAMAPAEYEWTVPAELDCLSPAHWLRMPRVAVLEWTLLACLPHRTAHRRWRL